MTRVLVIGSEEQMQRNIATIFEMEGFEVLSAARGREGLVMAAREKPDFILCDIMMPGRWP